MNKKNFPLLLLFPVFCLADSPTGILGGQDNGAPWAAFLDGSGNIMPIQASLLPSSGSIYSVDINNFSQAIIGGFDNNSNAYAAFSNSPSEVNAIAGLETNAMIQAVAINDSNKAVLAGTSPPTGITQNFYLALTSPGGTLTQIANIPNYAAQARTAAINNEGYVFGGGQTTTNHAYGVIIDPSNNVNVFHNGPPPGYYESSAMNEFNLTIAGGGDGNSSGSWASFIDANGVETVLPVSGGPIPSPVDSQILSVAINNSSNAIIGGYNYTGTVPYAALVTSSGLVTNLPVSGDALPASGKIKSVSINEAGNALIGGNSGSSPYAAFVSSSGSVTNLTMPSNGVINSVAIDQFGNGLIGGKNGAAAYAAVISPTGQVVSLSGLPAIGVINSVAIGRFFSNVPTLNLTGNNKRYAKYINKYAPQDAFYFLPAFFDGTLNQALESAEPTRNAAAVFAADNNMFSLNKSLSSHLRSQRRFKSLRRSSPPSQGIAFDDEELAEGYDEFKGSEYSTRLTAYADEDIFDEGYLFAAADELEEEEFVEEDGTASCGTSQGSERPFTLWFDAIGYLASQKSQHQTVGFDPYAAGFVLSLGRNINQHWQAGGGGGYTYTHIHEHHDAGHSDINQEYLFLYGSWSSTHFYADAALWGGLFQISNVRKIHMTGWDFRSTSHPNGWQLSPHAEFGYEHLFRTHWLKHQGQYSGWAISPFAMFDWVNSWQNSYREKGSGPFNAAQSSHHSSFLRSEIGLRFYELWGFCSWRFSLEEAVSYVNKKPFEVGTMNAFLVGSPGNFTMITLSGTENLAAAELSATFEPVNHVYPNGSVTYQGEYNSAFQSHQLTLEIAWDF